MLDKLPITLITQFYNLSWSAEPGHELRLLEQIPPIVDQTVAVVQDSLDDTLDIVSRYVKTEDIELTKCIYHPEPYRNLLLEKARNEWVLFLDQDMSIMDDPYLVLSSLMAESEDYDAFAFVNHNFLAPDRETPGSPWGEPAQCSKLGSYYFFKKSRCLGTAHPLLHYPFMFKEGVRLKQTDFGIEHRSMHYATERWKTYYPFVVGRLRQQYAERKDYLANLDRVTGCHWGSESTTFGKTPENPGGKADIKNGVQVAFLGGVERNQSWPLVDYFGTAGAHVIIHGDKRLKYHPRFIERSLELFAMFPDCAVVRPCVLGRAPEGMTPDQVAFGSALVLAPFDQLFQKDQWSLKFATLPRSMVRGWTA